MHNQEWSSYHGLTTDSLSVEFSLPGCDHTPLCNNHWAKLSLLSVSRSNMPIESPYGNHKVKCFSSNLLLSALRLGTDTHLPTDVPHKDDIIPTWSMHPGRWGLAPQCHCQRRNYVNHLPCIINIDCITKRAG